ncbi:MAG TPA: type II secretion system protein [Paucimonas sp.]|nr:type II secretion system protein [Paucimonas sp.]
MLRARADGAHARHRARGFSLLEFAIAVALFGVLATLLLERFSYYEEVAEKARVEATISQIRSAMRMRIAELMIGGRMQEAVLMAGQNPIDWLERKPDNYRGEFVDSAPGAVRPGEWYFDRRRSELVYVVRNARYFQSDQHEGKRIRLKVFSVRNHALTALEHTALEPTDTVELRLLEFYKWF